MKKAIVLIIVILMSSCAPKIHYDGISVKNFNVDYNKNSFEATFEEMSGDTFRNVNFQPGEEILLSYDIALKRGTVEVIVVNTDEKVIWKSDKVSSRKISSTKIKVGAIKLYRIIIRGDNATGSFKVSWQ